MHLDVLDIPVIVTGCMMSYLNFIFIDSFCLFCPFQKVCCAEERAEVMVEGQ